MSKIKKNPKIDPYFANAKNWRREMAKLRKILLGCQLTEDWKWNKPSYMFEESNVVILLPLKHHCALLLCKGALLDDTNGMLIKLGENTQAARQIRFTSLREILEKEAFLKAYIQQAIEVEKAGLDVVYKKITDFKIPMELEKKMDEFPALRTAFAALTPGRQRGYILHFSAPKQSKTREARVERCKQQILKGRGLNDR